MGSIQSSYVGIDPSFTCTGVGAVNPTKISHFYFRGPELRGKRTGGIGRLTALQHELRMHLEYLVRNLGPIKHVCIEGPAYAATNRADDLGQLRGVYAVCAAEFCETITVVPPTALKKFATGSGAATKEKMVKAAAAICDEKLLHDEADALWLAVLANGLEDESLKLKRYQIEVIDGIRNPKVKRRISTRHADNI